MDLKRDFVAGVFICLRPRIPYSPTPTHYIRVYRERIFKPSYESIPSLAESIPWNRVQCFLNVYKFRLCILIHTGKGGGEIEPERRLEGQQFTKLGQKYQHDWLYLRSINSDRHLPQSPFIQVNFFRWRHFSFVSIYLISPWSDPAVFLRGTI